MPFESQITKRQLGGHCVAALRQQDEEAKRSEVEATIVHKHNTGWSRRTPVSLLTNTGYTCRCFPGVKATIRIPLESQITKRQLVWTLCRNSSAARGTSQTIGSRSCNIHAVNKTQFRWGRRASPSFLSPANTNAFTDMGKTCYCFSRESKSVECPYTGSKSYSNGAKNLEGIVHVLLTFDKTKTK